MSEDQENCPKCGSIEVDLRSLDHGHNQASWLECLDCGWESEAE